MRVPLSSLSLVVALALSSTSALAVDRVAVIEFVANPPGLVTDLVLAAITDEARRAAVDVLPTSQFSVITKENQESVLRENGVDASALCEAECEVDVARTIGAALLVTGSVSKIGAKMSLHMKLFHAERGQVLKIVRVSAEDEAALYELAYDEGQKLFRDGLGLSGEAPAAAASAPSRVMATITARHVDGYILVDDTPVVNGGTVELSTGAHRIVVPDGRCQRASSTTISLGSEPRQEVTVPTQPRLTRVQVTASASGVTVDDATVLADGVPVGQTGQVLAVPVCTGAIGVTSSVYGASATSVALSADDFNTVHVSVDGASDLPPPEYGEDDGDTVAASDDAGDLGTCATCAGCGACGGVALVVGAPFLGVVAYAVLYGVISVVLLVSR